MPDANSVSPDGWTPLSAPSPACSLMFETIDQRELLVCSLRLQLGVCRAVCDRLALVAQVRIQVECDAWKLEVVGMDAHDLPEEADAPVDRCPAHANALEALKAALQMPRKPEAQEVQNYRSCRLLGQRPDKRFTHRGHGPRVAVPGSLEVALGPPQTLDGGHAFGTEVHWLLFNVSHSLRIATTSDIGHLRRVMQFAGAVLQSTHPPVAFRRAFEAAPTSAALMRCRRRPPS